MTIQDMQDGSPTPYPAVNALLLQLFTGAQAILGDYLLGMYLYGSLALGDFAPQRSDIDVLLVTTTDLPAALFAALQALHAHIASSDSPWVTELEASYIPQQALRRYDPAYAQHPHIARGSGQLTIVQHDSDWVIQRYVLREHGVVLAGPPLATLIDPVSPTALRRAVLETLYGWWGPMIADPTRLQHPAYRHYAILTMCRMIYTLQCGTVVSKPVAARWSQAGWAAHWSELIEQALDWPQPVPPDNLNATLDFLRFTVEQSQQFALPLDEA